MTLLGTCERPVVDLCGVSGVVKYNVLRSENNRMKSRHHFRSHEDRHEKRTKLVTVKALVPMSLCRVWGQIGAKRVPGEYLKVLDL